MCFDVVSHRKPSCHDAEVYICTVSVAHDIRRRRSEWLRSFRLHQAIFVMFVGVANSGLFDNVLATASHFLHDFFHTVPECERHHAKEPEAARRCFVGFQHFRLLLHCSSFHFLYTRLCTRVVVVVSAQPTEVMCESCLVSDGIREQICHCGCSPLTTFFAGYEEVLKGSIGIEATGVIQGGSTPLLRFIHEFTLSDYSIWFSDVLRQLVIGQER